MEQVKFVKDSLKKILLAPFYLLHPVSEAYSELSQTSEMELYVKTVNRHRGNHQKCSIKKVFLKISQSLFFESLAQMFSCECWEIFKNTFFTEHLWTTACSARSRLLLWPYSDYVFDGSLNSNWLLVKTLKSYNERIQFMNLKQFIVNLCLVKEK